MEKSPDDLQAKKEAIEVLITPLKKNYIGWGKNESLFAIFKMAATKQVLLNYVDEIDNGLEHF